MMSDVNDQRAQAARACRAIIEVAKRDPDVRSALAKLLSARGVSNIFDLAETNPEDVIMLGEAFTDLERDAPL